MNTTTTTTTAATGLGNKERPSKSALLTGSGQCASQPRRQVRLRLTPAVAGQLQAMPHKARAEVVAMIVNAALAGIDPKQLLGLRQELKNLGLLINQSLRLSRGAQTNVVALNQAVEVLRKLIIR